MIQRDSPVNVLHAKERKNSCTRGDVDVDELMYRIRKLEVQLEQEKGKNAQEGSDRLRYCQKSTPVITTEVGGQQLRALVDTGSDHTLVSEKASKMIEGELNLRRNPPRLQGVTGNPLRIIGMIKTKVNVGNAKVVTQWIPIVPDSYLATDILLGCDILNQANYHWNARKRTLCWGKVSYPFNTVKSQRGEVRQVRESPITLNGNPKHHLQVGLEAPVFLEPYQTRFITVPVREKPGTCLIVYPQASYSHNGHPYLVDVSEGSSIYVAMVNNSKKRLKYQKGTIIGSYELTRNIPPLRINVTREIHNDLLPNYESAKLEGTRVEKLEEKIREQNWDHLTNREQRELNELILEHERLFILGSDDLGLIEGPPAHIQVNNPQPSRAPIYRYPEQAKTIISDMLTDMEEKGIIEKSTAAWLSPIVLVNKPDGSKRMCLDYRRVNKKTDSRCLPFAKTR
ncbi:uncharacterized protein LOC143041505 [Oratosquilla oratoria]|uniref:uncharacterized protein LOC143041505 n=1 Tax=Oratosquilla oratoria TaxID=337810 RepID=UPI003F76EAD4